MPLSFLRSGALDPGRRRYPIVMDSMHMQYNSSLTHSPLRRELPTHKIRYCNSFCYNNTGRPSLDRFEIQVQLSFLIGVDVDSHLLHIISCCLVIQLVSHLASLSARSPDRTTLFQQYDHPIMLWNPGLAQHFHGSTIYHWNLRKLYELLTRPIKPLPELYYKLTGNLYYYSPLHRKDMKPNVIY